MRPPFRFLRAALPAGILLSAAAATTAPAQSATAQSAPAPRVTAIHADRVIIGDGTQITDAMVIVRGERILDVGPASSVRVPAGATRLELTGYTLLPGFIDAHTHLTSIDNDGGDLAVLKETPAHGAIYATINAQKTLNAGFTTVREAGSTDFVDAVVRDAINRGLIPGPRVHASGPALGSTGGHADVNGWSPFLAVPGTGAIVDGPDAVRKQVRTNIKYGADQIKIVATGGILSVGDAVGAAHGFLVVCDDDEGVSFFGEGLEGVEEAFVVARVEADGRLVQNIQNAAEVRAELGGEADALGFAAGEGFCGAVEC